MLVKKKKEGLHRSLFAHEQNVHKNVVCYNSLTRYFYLSAHLPPFLWKNKNLDR